MDKTFKTKLFSINKEESQDTKQNVKKMKDWIIDLILLMKSCFYKSELDKFIRHINDLYPQV